MFAFAILLCAAVLVTAVNETELKVDLSESTAASTDSTPTDSAKEVTGITAEASATEVSPSTKGDPTERADSDAVESPLTRISEVVIDFEARPEWVECDEEMNIGSVYRIAVSSGPHVRRRDARKELYKQLEIEGGQYVNELLGHPRAAFWLGFDGARVRSELVATDHIYDETINSPSFGGMHQSHALLEFGPEFRDEIQVAWDEIVVRGRLVAVGLAGGVVITTLCMFLGFFRADTATKGFYTGRLRFATVLVILGLVAAGIVLARSIPWLWL